MSYRNTDARNHLSPWNKNGRSKKKGGNSKISFAKLKNLKPLVTVIIPTHNYANLISETIDSVLNQTYSNIEIIVVDDGSVDNTAEIVGTYPKVKYVYQAHVGNRTPARAQNTALKVSKGEYIICLGADDKLVPTYIEKCYEIISQDSKIGIVFTGAKEFGADNKTRIPRQLHHRFSVFREPHGQIGSMMVRREVYSGPPKYDRHDFEFLGALSSVPSRIDGYDESLHSLEDWDLFIRAGLSGWKIRSISEPLLFARVHEGRVTAHADVSELWRKYPMMRGYALLSRAFDALVLSLQHPKTFSFRLVSKLYIKRGLSKDLRKKV